MNLSAAFECMAHTMKSKSYSKYFHNKISIKQLKPKFRRGIHVYMMPNKFYIKSSHKNKMFKKCRRVVDGCISVLRSLYTVPKEHVH